MTAPGLSHSEESGRTLARQPQIWGAVPLCNPDSVGREELLEQLRLRLVEPGGATAVLPEALRGMGGVGKSQTVVEYIYRHAPEYDILWWIPAEHPTMIRSSFIDLAKRLGIKASSAETAVPAVVETLRSGCGASSADPGVRQRRTQPDPEFGGLIRLGQRSAVGGISATTRKDDKHVGRSPDAEQCGDTVTTPASKAERGPTARRFGNLLAAESPPVTTQHATATLAKAHRCMC